MKYFSILISLSIIFVFQTRAQLSLNKSEVNMGLLDKNNNQVRLFFYNSSHKTLYLMRTQSGKNISAKIIQNKLLPKEYGEIVLSCTPSKKGSFNDKLELLFSSSNKPHLLKVKGNYTSKVLSSTQKCPDFNGNRSSKPKNVTWSYSKSTSIPEVHIQIIDDDAVPAKNITLVIDASISMNNTEKIQLVKNSLDALSKELSESDQLTVISYSKNHQTLLETQHFNKEKSISKLWNKIDNFSYTNGGKGIRKAYQLADSTYSGNSINQIILITDGAFNIGDEPEKLIDTITEFSDKGISLSVMCIKSENWAFSEMKQLARAGKGQFGNIKSVIQAQKTPKKIVNFRL